MAIIFIRTLIVFVAIISALRIMGKRQLGELELSELVVAVLISDLASHPMQDIGIPLLNGLIPILTLLCCEILISAATLKSIKFRSWICGKPSILINNGKIIQSELLKNRFSLDELVETLRKRDITDLSTVRYAILEVDGTLNPILYSAHQTPCLEDLSIQSQDHGLPVTLISDGRVLSQNLQLLGKDENWLKQLIIERGAAVAKQVLLLTIDDVGDVYFCKKEKWSKIK